jgi:hypothetical protein
MKTLLILLLVLALSAILFLTRPSKADFEKYIRETTTVVDGKPTGGKTVTDTVKDKLRTFAAAQANKSAAEIYLEQCTYQNRFLWINVMKDGKVVFTGAAGQWFERSKPS